MQQSTLSYEQAIHRLEELVKELEQTEALSMDVYRHKAEEAKQLLAICRQQLTHWEEEMSTLMEKE